MLKSENNSDLNLHNIDSKFYFFYQSWRELTCSYTLDSYQYRLVNILSGLKELSDVILKTIEGFYISDLNIQECKEELLIVIEKDIILKKYYENEYKLLISILHSKHTTVSEKKSLMYNANCILHKIEKNYFEKLILDLEDSIKHSNNVNIRLLSCQIVCCLINKGWASSALFDLAEILYESSVDESKWNMFKKEICSPELKCFSIIIPFNIKSSPNANTVVQQTFLNLEDNIKKKLKSEILEEFSNISPEVLKNKEYILINVESHDFYTATHHGCRKYADILNALSFYNIIRPWTFNNLSFIVLNPSSNSFKILDSKAIYSTTDDYFEGAVSTFKISKRIIMGEQSILKSKLLSSYSFSNIGKATLSQEEKFINLWIALESLCKSDMCSNIIENVLKNVPPALCMRYISSLCRNFIDDCFRCKITFDFTTKTFNMKSTIKRENIKSIIEILNDPLLYNELKTKCSINDLLLFRCEEIHDIVTDLDKSILLIKTHHNNVKYQLSRLYRIRNQIAHKAFESSNPLTRYIEHLSGYLSLFLSELLICSENHQIKDFPEILVHLQNNYNIFLDISNSKDINYKKASLNQLITQGIINLL